LRCPPRRRGEAIVELLDGKSVDWLEKVSDEQYAAAAPTL
jgi:hypothetical protein